MEVEDFLETYVRRSDPHLQSDIASRKEFKDVKLERTEPVTGELLNHQKIVQRLIAPWTPMTSLLADDKMGTGKTRLGASVAEQWLDTIDTMRRTYETTAIAETIPRKRVLILVKNPKLEVNFRSDIVAAFPTKYEATFKIKEIKTELKTNRRINALLNDNYEFDTFRRFASLIDRNTREGISQDFIDNYSNRLIIIDEAHNLRPQSNIDVPYYTDFELYLQREKIPPKDIDIVTATAQKFLRENKYEQNLAVPLARAVISAHMKHKLPSYYKNFIEYLDENGISTRDEKLLSFLNQYLKENSIESSDKDKRLVIAELNGETKSDMEVYLTLHKFLHLINKPRIILLTGSPMFDTKNEISYISNLILPEGEQMSPLPSDDEIRNKLRGRVRYLRLMTTEIPKKDEGNTKYTKHMKVYDVTMSKFQQKYYLQAYKKDREELKSGTKGKFAFYQNSRQAADMVFPDGSWGASGHLKYSSAGKYSDEFKKIIQEGKLGEYNAKLNFIIKDIEKHQGELAYIFSEKVAGGGIDTIELVLNNLGYQKSTGESKSKGLRYAVITGTTSSAETRRILKTFKSPENRHGDYIKIIIGSRSASEGLSYFNIMRTYLYAPMWNTSSNEQAIYRSIRVGAHRALIKEFNERGISLDKFRVRVFRLASVVKDNPDESIDIHLYRLAEEKDIGIQHVERILKEISVDCELTKARNRLPQDVDYSRECEYMQCDYVCADGEMPMPTNYNTWTVHYSRREMDNIQNTLRNILATEFLVDINDIEATTPTVLNMAIMEFVKKNKYLVAESGKSYQIEFSRPYLHLVPVGYNAGLDGVYYVNHTQLQKEIPISNLVHIKQLDNDLETARVFCTDGNERNIEKLTQENKIALVQKAIEANKSKKGNERAKRVLELFKDSITESGHTLGEVPMKYVKGKWVGETVADDEAPKKKERKIGERKVATKDRSYRDLMDDMVFGVMVGDVLFIVDKRFDSEAEHDKRKLNTGRNFNNYTKLQLIDIIKYEGLPQRKGQIPINIEYLRTLSKRELAQQIEDSDKKSYPRFTDDAEKYTVDELIYILSWSTSPKTNKKDLAKVLYEVFEKKNKLVIPDS